MTSLPATTPAPCLPALHECLEALAFAAYAAESGDAGCAADALLAAAVAGRHAFGDGTPGQAALGVLLAAVAMAADGEPVPAGLLAEGRTVTYAPDEVWQGNVWADLRDARGRVIATGNGRTQAEALAVLLHRLGGAR